MRKLTPLSFAEKTFMPNKSQVKNLRQYFYKIRHKIETLYLLSLLAS